MPSLLDLPAEVRLMIYHYMLEGENVKLKYVPRMHVSTKRLAEIHLPRGVGRRRRSYRGKGCLYQYHDAPETALLFVSKELTREYLDVLMQHSRVDISRAFATNVPEKHDFLKIHTYPVVERLRISQAHFHHLDCPSMLATLMSNLPQLKLLELDYVPDYEIVVPEHDPAHQRIDLQPEHVKAIQERLQTDMVPYADAMKTWQGLSNQFEIITSFFVTYRNDDHWWFDPIYKVTANFTTRSLVTQMVSECRLDFLKPADHHELLPDGLV